MLAVKEARPGAPGDAVPVESELSELSNVGNGVLSVGDGRQACVAATAARNFGNVDRNPGSVEIVAPGALSSTNPTPVAGCVGFVVHRRTGGSTSSRFSPSVQSGPDGAHSPRRSGTSPPSLPPAVTTYRLDIAYDGTRFKGWARQAGERTVQGEIEAALERLFGETVPVTVAGRTDAGVHATGQVASFQAEKSPPDDLRRALNALTPPDVAITEAGPVADGFDARRSARSRRYRYRLQTGPVPDPFERRYAVHWTYPLDREALDACAGLLVGTHDFTAFTPTDTEHVRFERNVFEAVWQSEPEGILSFEVEADSFMRNMVRAMVGTMLEVAAGRRSVDNFAALLEGRPRPEGGETAPARGLFLIEVGY